MKLYVTDLIKTESVVTCLFIMMKSLFPDDFVPGSDEEPIFHVPKHWMHDWVEWSVEMSSLFCKFPDLCQAAHPTFHELAILGGIFQYHIRGVKPTTEVQHINGNLCWRDIAQDCSHYVRGSKKIAIGKNTVLCMSFIGFHITPILISNFHV